MLAAVNEQSLGAGNEQWLVLVDSETFKLNDADIANEAHGSPLPNRFRNTVAHELVHLLALEPSSFGVHLRERSGGKNGSAALVKCIERETERLSPLLLWPENAVVQYLARLPASLSIRDLTTISKRMGISRAVIVNRLLMLRAMDQSRLLESKALSNIAVGIGVWSNGGSAAVKNWPVFAQFDRGIAPRFLLKVDRRSTTIADSFCSDTSFAMLGGFANSTCFTTDAGTKIFPNAEQMNVELSIEDGARTAGTEFFFVCRKLVG